MKKYKATARGFAEGRVIEPGETFHSNAKKGSWMEEVKEAEEPQRTQRREAQTRS